MLTRTVSATVGALALGAAVYLGVTAPLVSPVQQTPPAAAPADPTGSSPNVVQPNGQNHGPRNRDFTRDFGRHR